jgi:membrane protein implicated in regulation of membrane protease activity
MMENYIPWMVENAHWLWLSLGVLLLASEIVAPGFYLIWIGVAGVITGILAWLMPDLGFSGHGLFFAVTGTLSIYVGHRFFYGQPIPNPEKPVNIRGAQHVGKTYVVAEAIENGRGHVSVGDSRWLAEGPDSDVGQKVRVISVEGTILKVESVSG